MSNLDASLSQKEIDQYKISPSAANPRSYYNAIKHRRPYNE